ncbi:hypothetical protein FA95DRAFT_1680248 [Auriscalpium vulgare]|uniref:Uncharacterized protein n=1 Tax=Auriscalpium vulgare TaxID=40419 RepID=A0ACB8RNM5_9AGAM|nr:hypothetical protein FA95DRAFT_1680248 [Auriscalpium vulgare]
MTNFEDPKVELSNYLSFVKLVHVFAGIFIWEYVSTLYFEWEVVTGRRPYRWTLLVYSGTRLLALVNAAMNLALFNTTSPMNCELYIKFQLFFAYSALAAGSSLMLLRIIAIWDRNVYVAVSVVAVWLMNLGLLIDSIVAVKAIYVPGTGCIITNTTESKKYIAATFSTDLFLLIMMLAGLLRTRQKAGSFTIWRVLYTQGLVWLVVATVGELPPLILIQLNLNDPWNLMFQVPGLMIMAICSTRMYRDLFNLSPKLTTSSDNHRSKVSIVRFGGKSHVATAGDSTTVVPMNPLEVTVRVDREGFEVQEASDGFGKPRRLDYESEVSFREGASGKKDDERVGREIV